jgi:NAD(P)-dependent dehydrogenase (short-subunit alcohol dehydrogenase family)
MLLNEKIALVTGSTHGIGLAIARAFAREGAKVIVGET